MFKAARGQEVKGVELDFYSQLWMNYFDALKDSKGLSREAIEFARKADLGFVQLDNKVILALMNAGVKPLQEENLIFEESSSELIGDKPHAFFVFGFPWCYQGGTEENPTWDLFSLRLNGTEGSDDFPAWDPPVVRFEPDWGETSMPTVEGMSGGPVCLFVGKVPYLMGIQTDQLRRRTRIKHLTVVHSTYFLTVLKSQILDKENPWILDRPGINCT